MTTTEHDTNNATQGVSLIDFLWPRVQASLAAVTETRQSRDERLSVLLISFRTEVLLMGAEPACTWAEVEKKVVVQSLIRHDQACRGAPRDLHLDHALEACIALDHATLNGDDRPDTPPH